MTTYLLQKLSSERRELLVSAGIPLFEFDAETSSVLFEEVHKQRVLEVLNCTGKESESEFEGIVILKLRARKAANQAATAAVEPPSPSDEQLQKRARSRDNYIKACGDRMQELLISAREALTQRAKKVPAVQSKFFHASRASYILENLVAARTPQAVMSQLQEEFNRVLLVDKVLSAKMTGSNLCIKTRSLLARLPSGKTVEIGTFLIMIDLDGKHNGVRWFNCDRRVNGAANGMNAPYVFSNGEPAVSEIRTTMMELLARLELSVVAELAIQFVENVFDDEFGKHAENWPDYRAPTEAGASANSGESTSATSGLPLDPLFRFLPKRRSTRKSPRWD